MEPVEDGAATPDTEDHGSVGVEVGSARRRSWASFSCEWLVFVGARPMVLEEAPSKEDRWRGKQRERRVVAGSPWGKW